MSQDPLDIIAEAYDESPPKNFGYPHTKRISCQVTNLKEDVDELKIKELLQLAEIIKKKLDNIDSHPLHITKVKRIPSINQYDDSQASVINTSMDDNRHHHEYTVTKNMFIPLLAKRMSMQPQKPLESPRSSGIGAGDDSPKISRLKRRGSQLHVDTKKDRLMAKRNMESVSPSFKFQIRESTRKNSPVKKKSFGYFFSRIGIEEGEVDINKIMEGAKAVSLKPKHLWEPFFPFVLGAVGLLLMLVIYFY